MEFIDCWFDPQPTNYTKVDTQNEKKKTSESMATVFNFDSIEKWMDNVFTVNRHFNSERLKISKGEGNVMVV